MNIRIINSIFSLFLLIVITSCIASNLIPTAIGTTYIQSVLIQLPNKSNSTIVFDFDTGEINNSTESDILISISQTGFLIAKPENNASGLYLTTLSALDMKDFTKNTNQCSLYEDNFLHAGKPISAQGDVFCWKTNQNKLVLFLIEKLNLEYSNIKIEISYSILN